MYWGSPDKSECICWQVLYGVSDMVVFILQRWPCVDKVACILQVGANLQSKAGQIADKVLTPNPLHLWFPTPFVPNWPPFICTLIAS